MTFTGETFAGLGVTPGTYVWHFGKGANADSITLQIGAVPEPASLTLLAGGLAGLGLVLRTRRASSASRPISHSPVIGEPFSFRASRKSSEAAIWGG